ncbi:extensin family protein [uncultured Jannaschia sp.]|uniref:extensin-like domain-containing protein n=1 Tax=uncultured Jannaschia sp. TaxID=293347 RepID=UPI00263770D8|nr:extensin family protein [uncultured Jannaschia sp.]
MIRFLALLAMTAPALAEPRPVPRPTSEIVVMSSRGAVAVAPEVQAPEASVRPVTRLDDAVRDARAGDAARRMALPLVDVAGLVRQAFRPMQRDDELILAMSRQPRGQSAAGGGICGRGSIQGTAIPAVPGPGACGIPNAVRITSVSGLALSRPTRMDCDTAQALDQWVRAGVLPEVGRTGGGAVALQVAAGYACRTRNNQSGAKISEHGRGRAIDISAIRLADGSRISVLDHWGGGERGRILRALWRAACGPFGTVLGPESDRFHRDHFHFDTARYRSGSYCR